MLNTKTIGNKIAEARKRINISQSQLAELLFISPQAVGKWERGESMPDIITFNRLAEILDVDLNYFSESIPEKESEETYGKQKSEIPSIEQEKKMSWDMSRSNWVDADFSGLKNLKEKFSSSNMQQCRFNNSDLSGLLLKANNVSECNFEGSDISDSQIQNSNLGNNIFNSSLLKRTEFSTSNIERCDFSNVNFAEAKFAKSFVYGCDFSGADFSDVVFKSGGFSGVKSNDLSKNEISSAVWCRTSFIDNHIADIVFTGNIEECYFENCEFTRVTFQEVTFVNTFFKNNKKLKKVRFVDCKADRMTYEFLKQGKADLKGVSLISD